MKNLKNISLTLIVFIGFGLLSSTISAVYFGEALKGYRTSTGGAINITDLSYDKGAYGQGYKVTNTSGKDYFIPTKTKAEWDAFKVHKPSGVSIESIRLKGIKFKNFTTDVQYCYNNRSTWGTCDGHRGEADWGEAITGFTAYVVESENRSGFYKASQGVKRGAGCSSFSSSIRYYFNENKFTGSGWLTACGRFEMSTKDNYIYFTARGGYTGNYYRVTRWVKFDRENKKVEVSGKKEISGKYEDLDFPGCYNPYSAMINVTHNASKKEVCIEGNAEGWNTTTNKGSGCHKYGGYSRLLKTCIGYEWMD